MKILEHPSLKLGKPIQEKLKLLKIIKIILLVSVFSAFFSVPLGVIRLSTINNKTSLYPCLSDPTKLPKCTHTHNQTWTQPAITCSKLTMETLEQGKCRLGSHLLQGVVWVGLIGGRDDLYEEFALKSMRKHIRLNMCKKSNPFNLY